MNQQDDSSGSSNYLNQKVTYVIQQSDYINQSAVKVNSYAALQGVDWSRNDYKQLDK